jgi:cell division protein FtsA
MAIPEGQQILHVLPQYYQIDGGEPIQNPEGMHGIRLEAKVHIITGSVASVQNIIHCCQLAGIKVSDVVLEQLASADAVLSKDEIDLGVAVLDIGGGTSDLAVYQNGSIRYTKVFPVAGNHFTNDLAIGLKTTISGAEQIKHAHGLAYKKLMKADELLEIDSIQGSGKEVFDKSLLVNILGARAHELLSIVHKEVVDNHLQNNMTTGLVITGGGALLKGVPELAEEIFEVPVRIGAPKTGNILPESLDNPIYATGYGLLVYKMKRPQASMQQIEGPIAIKIFFRMKSWMADFF